MKFKLSVSLGNDAMQTQADVRDAIIRTFSMEADCITLLEGDSHPIFDTNGNKVGEWYVA